MVTAGIFLVLRSSAIFTLTPTCSFVICLLGLWTANVSSLCSFSQYDIKKIIAFSTTSNLGMMFFACGAGYYSYALFHLINHAFFKALLFLCAGSVIHATSEQDIRRMGGLREALPITYITMLIASLSLVGFPFLSGFYSKDYILAALVSNYGADGYLIFIITSLAIIASSFYSFRLIYYVFFGPCNLSKKSLLNVTEGSIFLYGPLVIFVIPSIISGFFLQYLFLEAYVFHFDTVVLEDSMDYEYSSSLIKFIPAIMSLFGIFLVLFLNLRVQRKTHFSFMKYSMFTDLTDEKLLSDLFYNNAVARPFLRAVLNTIYLKIEKGFFSFFGSFGIYKLLTGLSKIIEDDDDDAEDLYEDLIIATLIISACLYLG
jgi:NADH-ubiquinone oxidoreductase chain 5